MHFGGSPFSFCTKFLGAICFFMWDFQFVMFENEISYYIILGAVVCILLNLKLFKHDDDRDI
jgi:hypothetical protein